MGLTLLGYRIEGRARITLRGKRRMGGHSSGGTTTAFIATSEAWRAYREGGGPRRHSSGYRSSSSLSRCGGPAPPLVGWCIGCPSEASTLVEC